MEEMRGEINMELRKDLKKQKSELMKQLGEAEEMLMETASVPLFS